MSSAIVPPATGVSTESTKPKLYAHLYRGGRNDCGSTCSTLPKQKGLGHISCFFSRSDFSPCTSSQHHVVICVHTACYALPLRHTCTQTRREETMIQRGPNQIKYKRRKRRRLSPLQLTIVLGCCAEQQLLRIEVEPRTKD